MINSSLTVNSVLDSQRKESEARSLLQDLEKLISLKGERKLRWVWELMQNAKDCSTDQKKVNISFKLTKDKLVFEHDGVPFQLDNLIALVRKTSTKSIEGLDDTTGKFGTGFVTTHVLNTKVTLCGLLQNNEGSRLFSLLIDRSFDKLPALMQALENTYKEIDIINESPAMIDISGIKTKYEYELEDYKFTIAKEGLEQLQRNLEFTLLINKEEISSVSITDETNQTTTYSIDSPQMIFQEVGFSKIIRSGLNDAENESGLFFSQSANLTIACPAMKIGNSFSLSNISEQARIFRNFPLIGTEKSHFPFLIHSKLFQPTEPRDGIRTLKDKEDRPDKHADENRKVIKKYVDFFQSFFIKLTENRIENIHLLAESGLPDDLQNYLSRDWFVTDIQNPLRQFLLQHDLVKTVEGLLIKIEQARFIRTYDFETETDLYEIVSQLFPSNCPDRHSYKDWKIIIEQDAENWPNGIYIDVEDVVKEVEKTVLGCYIDKDFAIPEQKIKFIVFNYLYKNNEIGCSPVPENYSGHKIKYSVN